MVLKIPRCPLDMLSQILYEENLDCGKTHVMLKKLPSIPIPFLLSINLTLLHKFLSGRKNITIKLDFLGD